MQQGAASGSGSDGKGGSSAAGRTATPVKARFGFIGIGKMATAIIKGMLDSGMSTSENIIGSAPSDRNMGPLKEMGVKTTHDNLEVAQRSTVIVLAVKPQLLWPVVEQIRSRVTPGHLIVSVVAGVSTEQLAAAFGKGTRVVRVVPNTPCAIRHGTTAVTAGSNATPQDTELVRSIFEQMGVVRVLPERVMDVVTGLAGSGPAFVFLFLEALSDGAVQAGLPRDVAHEFAASMVHGAAALAKETRTHPGVLKDAVCSPGGTTIAGVRSLEDARFRAAAMGAVTTAAARSEELRLKGPTPAALAA